MDGKVMKIHLTTEDTLWEATWIGILFTHASEFYAKNSEGILSPHSKYRDVKISN